MKHYSYLVGVLLLVFIGCDRDNSGAVKGSYEHGVAYASEGDFEKAEKAFKKALNVAVDKRAIEASLNVVKDVLSQKLDQEVASLFFKGVKFANEGQMLHAYSELSKVVRKAPQFSEAYYERGLVNGRMKMYKKAVSDFTKVIDLNPTDVAAYNNRGLAYARGAIDYNKALGDFNKAIEIDPEFAEAYDNRGIAFMKKSDNKKRACGDWKRACDLKRCNSYERAKRSGYCK
jgi:tetratricopeptide (TPR) repeat protein